MSTEKGEKMKLFTAVVLITSLVLGVAYLGGVFDAEVNITVNQKVKHNMAELTLSTLESAHDQADKAFEELEKRLKENKENNNGE